MPSQTIYYLPDGMVADANTGTGGGTDNAAALQASIAAAQAANLPLIIPPGKYLIKSTVTIDGADCFSMSGVDGGYLGPDSTAFGTWLVWGGAASGTMLSLKGIKCQVKNLGICSASNTSLDRCIDVEKPSIPPGLSSQHLFQNVVAYGLIGAIRAGWVVGEDNSANNEFMHWKSCETRFCTYAGVSIPNSTKQAKNLKFEDCTFSGSGAYGDYGINFNGGSANFYDCNFDSLGVCVAWFGGAFEPCNFIGCTGENNRRFIQGTGLTNLNIIGCRFSLGAALSPQVQGSEWISGGGDLVIEGCAVELDNNISGWIRPSDSGTLTVRSTRFAGATPFSSDGNTTWRGNFTNVRISTDNLLPDGVYYQRFVPGLLGTGNGIAFWTTAYPPPITYSGGTPILGVGAYQLYPDGAGNLWWKVGTSAPKQVLLSP